MTAKIFGIGFHKTGTSSLARALRLLGYDAIQGDPPCKPPYGDGGISLIRMIEAGRYRLPTIEKHDAFTDNPYFRIWREIDENYPGSRFILTVRDPKEWIRSCIRYYRYRQIYPMRAWMFGEHANPASSDAARNTWLRAYREHNEAVRRHFRERPDDLLILDVTRRNSWPPLCKFLGRPIPDTPFPHENEFDLRRRFGYMVRRLGIGA